MEKPHTTNNVQNTPYHSHLNSFFILLLCLVTTVIFSACASQNNGTPNGSNASIGASTSTTNQSRSRNTPTVISSLPVNGGYPIKVYFSKKNSANSGDVVVVDRISPSSTVATFAIEQLIAGPTQTEQNQGLFSQLHDSINNSGPSNCANQSDFLLTIDQKAAVAEKGTATLQFCRDINSPGVGSDARIQAEISTTLKQFSTIQKVVILLKSGHCFGDESGLDMCLK